MWRCVVRKRCLRLTDILAEVDDSVRISVERGTAFPRGELQATRRDLTALHVVGATLGQGGRQRDAIYTANHGILVALVHILSGV